MFSATIEALREEFGLRNQELTQRTQELTQTNQELTQRIQQLQQAYERLSSRTQFLGLKGKFSSFEALMEVIMKCGFSADEADPENIVARTSSNEFVINTISDSSALKSGVKYNFSTLKLTAVDLPNSKMALKRWSALPFANTKFSQLFDSDNSRQVIFLAKQVTILNTLRLACQKVGVQDEVDFFQPLFSLYLRQLIDAANFPFQVKGGQGFLFNATLVDKSGTSFVASGEADLLISDKFDADNIRCVVELKPPFKTGTGFLQTGVKNLYYQLILECEGLGQHTLNPLSCSSSSSSSSSSPRKSELCKSFATDLMAITVDIRVVNESGIACHMFSERIEEARDFIMVLLMVLSDISLDDMNEILGRGEAIPLDLDDGGAFDPETSSSSSSSSSTIAEVHDVPPQQSGKEHETKKRICCWNSDEEEDEEDRDYKILGFRIWEESCRLHDSNILALARGEQAQDVENTIRERVLEKHHDDELNKKFSHANWTRPPLLT